jgi:Phosphotransferase enzyme family
MPSLNNSGQKVFRDDEGGTAMPDCKSRHDQVTYRLVLIAPDSGNVLAELDGNDLRLPRIAVPRWTRPARHIQHTMHTLWNATVVILDFLSDCPGSPVCIAELLSARIPEGLFAVPFDSLEISELTHQERETLREICSGDPGNRGPFSRTGWIDEVMAWIQRSTHYKAPFTGEIEQHNAGGSFALARFALQNGTSYWLKAVGSPNLHEFSITTALAGLCPEHLPAVIATNSEWSAWVMEDTGESPGQNSITDFLESAVIAMAELQKKTADHTVPLLDAGAADQRMEVLAGHIDELITFLDDAMQLQTSIKVPPLGTKRLHEIGEVLKDACAAMEALCIPNTIIHNDINPGNILLRNAGCVFIDWCEACVGNPFLTLQSLLLLAPKNCGDYELNTRRLKQLYGSRWVSWLPACNIDRAFALAPLLAIASHLYGRGDWLKSDRRDDPPVQSYARALARHMDLAASASQLTEALCR